MRFVAPPTGALFVSMILHRPHNLEFSPAAVSDTIRDSITRLHSSMTRDHAAMVESLLLDMFAQDYRLGTIYSTPIPHSHEELYRMANWDQPSWEHIPMHGMDQTILANPRNTYLYSQGNSLLLHSGRSPLPGDIVLHHCEMQGVMTLLRAYMLLPIGMEPLMPESQMDPTPTMRII